MRDLRAINKVIVPKGPLQPGILLTSLLPKAWPIIVINFKNCLSSIPLEKQDKETFAFTVPTYNHENPAKKYHWYAVPQGMLKSPTLCQYLYASH